MVSLGPGTDSQDIVPSELVSATFHEASEDAGPPGLVAKSSPRARPTTVEPQSVQDKEKVPEACPQKGRPRIREQCSDWLWSLHSHTGGAERQWG